MIEQIESLLLSIDLPFPLLAFFAGIISILSPCILPLLPAVMAYSTGVGRLRPLAIVIGIAVTFTMVGVAAAAFFEIFFMFKPYLELAAGLVILLMGLIMFLDRPFVLSNIPSRFSFNIRDNEGIAGGFLLGLSLGIVWIPCTGPILTAIIMGVLLKGGIMYGGVLLFTYSMGLGLPMLLIAYSTKISSGKLRTVSRYDNFIKRGAGAVIMIVATWLIYRSQSVLYLI